MTNEFKKKALIYHVKKYGMPAVNISKFETKRFEPYKHRFRYDDTGEIVTIDMRDPEAFEMIFCSDHPITVLGRGG